MPPVVAHPSPVIDAPCSAAVRGPTEAGERVLAPDLARGAMLLLIAVANTQWYLFAAPVGAVWAHPPTVDAADRVVQTIMSVTVDLRVYPMFAFLFGYGVVQLFQRQIDAGTTALDARRLLHRRHAWMMAFGVVHAVLLWSDDVVGIYGLFGLILVRLFLHRSDRTLAVWAGALAGLGIVTTLGAVAFAALAHRPIPGLDVASLAADSHRVTGDPSYLHSVLPRAAMWLESMLLQGVLSMVMPSVILLAMLAARHRVLEDPGRHRRLLQAAASGGLAVGWVGGLPMAMIHAGVLSLPGEVRWVTVPIQSSTGMFAGVGYVALFGLLGHRLQQCSRHLRTDAAASAGKPLQSMLRRAADEGVRTVTALGRRSLTGYLAQSVICAPVLAAWGFGFGARLSSWSMALLASGIWWLTLGLAWLLERRGTRGPAEALLRRLAYPSAVAAGGLRGGGGGPQGPRPPRQHLEVVRT